MATAGPNYPTSTSSVDPLGDVYNPWTSPSNANADDGAVTSSDINPDDAGQSFYLDCLTFGFSIPSANIDGITVEIERRDKHATTPRNRDLLVQLMKGGTPVGTNKASASVYPNTLTVATYGGASDLWGTTWSASEVNASGFGLRFQSEVSTGTSNRTTEVDFVRITINYTEGGGGGGGPNRISGLAGGSAATSISVSSMVIPINMPAT